MIAILLAWALAGDQWATDALDRIGGPASWISLDSRVYAACEVQPRVARDLETISLLLGGWIDETEAMARNAGEP